MSECKHRRFSREGCDVGFYWCKETHEKVPPDSCTTRCKKYAVDAGGKRKRKKKAGDDQLGVPAGCPSNSGADVVVPDAHDVPKQYPAAPCPDGGPALAPLVLGMALGISGREAHQGLPLVAVVCRRASDGCSSSACALGNYSRSISQALPQMPRQSIVTL